MKVPQPKNIKFIAFNDGICNLYTIDEDDEKSYIVNNLSFKNKTLGYGRYYTAKAANVKVDRVILIPRIPVKLNEDDVEYYVEIGEDTFVLELVQELDDTSPKVYQLTLRKISI